eukprot:7386841-Prymnesium_polylepis.1
MAAVAGRAGRPGREAQEAQQPGSRRYLKFIFEMATTSYVSVLTSDEGSDDADEPVLARLCERGKPMKHVEKRVLQVGK